MKAKRRKTHGLNCFPPQNKIFFFFMSGLFLALSLGACAGLVRTALVFDRNTRKDHPNSIPQGARLYSYQCAGCHGSDGRGNGPEAQELGVEAPDLVDYAQHRSDKAIAAKIYSGSFRGMPSHSTEFTQEEIWDLANFLKSLRS